MHFLILRINENRSILKRIPWVAWKEGKKQKKKETILPPLVLEKPKCDPCFPLKLESEICLLFYYFNTFSSGILVMSLRLPCLGSYAPTRKTCNSFLDREGNFYREQNIDLISKFHVNSKSFQILNITNQHCICDTFQPFLYSIHTKWTLTMAV